MNILFIEDNLNIIKGIEYLFKQSNYNIITKTNIKESIEFLKNKKVNLIILDISLPDGNGLDFYKNHIKKYNVKTIFLTANDNIDDICYALDNGACDYITKPFRGKELLSRINRILKNNTTKIKDITFDLNKMEVYKNDNIINLTGLEIKILFLLVNNIGKIVKRNELIESIWEWTGNDVYDNTVTVYLKRIREKLGCDIIKTIKGIGYRIDEEYQ